MAGMMRSDLVQTKVVIMTKKEEDNEKMCDAEQAFGQRWKHAQSKCIGQQTSSKH